MHEITPAVAKLKAFVTANFRTVQEAARELEEAPSAFTSWFSAGARPGGTKRAELRAWTGGAVDPDDWLTKKERTRVRRLERVAARRATERGEAGK